MIRILFLVLSLQFAFAQNYQSTVQFDTNNVVKPSNGVLVQTNSILIALDKIAAPLLGTANSPYGSSWANNTNAPTRKDVYDKIEQGFFRVVSTIDELVLLETQTNVLAADPVFVTDQNRGGLFVLADRTTTNRGTLFASTNATKQWNRIFSGGFDIRWFGAIPNDGTDDTTAIQAAVDAVVDGKMVFVPAGRFELTTVMITGTNTISIFGDPGSELFQRSTATNSMITTGSDTNTQSIRIKGIRFDGNNPAFVSRYSDPVDNTSIIAVRSHNKDLTVENCVFYRSIRAAIRTAGGDDLIWRNEFREMLTNNPADWGSPKIHTIWAQPTGEGKLRFEMVGNRLYGPLTNRADREKVPNGLFITEQELNGGTNVYKSVLIKDNYCEGLFTLVDAYNGTRNGVASDNHVRAGAYSGFKIQRSDKWEISGGSIIDLYNADGDTFAVAFSPLAREGSSPFIGSRLNEQHYDFIVDGVFISDVYRSAIYIDAGASTTFTNRAYVLVHNCIIDKVTESSSGDLQVVSTIGSDIDIVNCWFKKIPRNILWNNWQSERIRFNWNKVFSDGIEPDGWQVLFKDLSWFEARNNWIELPETAATNGIIGITVRNATNGVIADNWVKNANTSYDIRDNSQMIFTSRNRHLGSGTEMVVATNSVVFRENDLWAPWAYRHDTNGATVVAVKNQIGLGNTSARALFNAVAIDSSAYIGAFPSDFADSWQRDQGVFGLDAGAAGGTFYGPFTNQQFRFVLGTAPAEVLTVQWDRIIPHAPIYFNNDNTDDIGHPAVQFRPRSIYAGTSINAPLLGTTNSPYGVGWNGNTNAPTRDDVYDKIESLPDGDQFAAISLSDLTTTIMATNNAAFYIFPRNVMLRGAWANLLTASSSGNVVVDVHLNGTTIMPTNKITVEANENWSGNATNQPIMTTTNITAGQILTFDIDSGGTGAAGLQVVLEYRE